MEKEAQRKTLYEAYTDYIDPATITVNHYLKEPFYSGQEPYFECIQQWVEDDIEPNRPLVFKTTPGVGVKTILSHWYHNTLEANTEKKEKILPIIHFASSGSNNSNYFYCLYRIVIKLREILKIKQGVDLLEQKIRKYFAYWLDICSTQVERQKVVCSSEDIYSKIVIVIEGVDKFTDHQTGKQANIAFWLPEFFPKNVKVICTVNDPSDSLDYFAKKQCKILPIHTSPVLAERLLKETLEKKTIFDGETEKNLRNTLQKIYSNTKEYQDVYKVIKIYSAFFLVGQNRCKSKDALNLMKKTIQAQIKNAKLQKISKANELYDVIIEMYSHAPAFKGKLIETLMYLSLTQKGITMKQFIQLTKFSEEECSIFESVFKPLIIRHQKIFSIKCRVFTQHLISKEGAGKDPKLTKYHEKISEALETTFNSIRKLEEQTYHLFVSKSYFKLKEIVSSIENFLLMFNPNNKYELSRYWQKLEEKGFDPVIEYNKAIESFAMHYHPSDENLFRIIVQISRFLKQFCDFQTYETPGFRHPFIEGNMAELQKIGLLGELTDLGIYVDNSFNSSDEPDFISSSTLEEQLKQVRDKYFPKQKEEGTLVSPQTLITTTVEQVEKLANSKKITKKSNTQILSQIQQLNVDVPMNRDKFRAFYLNSLQQYMKSEDFDPCQNDPGYFVVEDETDSEKIQTTSRPQFSFNKVRENYRMRLIDPSLYYYKRWIWIQFPWACISLHNNYSNTPQFCNNIEVESQSYEEEAKHTKQALIVAIQAKEKKKMMFTKKSDDYGSNFGSRTKHMAITTNKFSTFRAGQKSSMRSRVLQKTFSGVDLHLNSLTKELEMRKKDMPTDQKENDGFFLSEIKENCQEDMKFISQRKQFQIPGIQGIPANQILPKLKWTIKDHTNYQISYIKTHIEEKKKKLNKIIYENKKLADIYKQLKLKENLTKKSMSEQDTDKNPRKNRQLEELAKKKEEVINQFCKSLLQKERLKIILKLCAENKTRNEEYLASLNYFLQNLKKMITWERNHIKEITAQMNGKRALKEKKQTMQMQKTRNQKIVEKQAKNYLEEKEKLEQQIENISLIIADDLRDQKDRLQNSLEGHMKNCQQKNKMMMQEKRTKQLEQQLKTLQEEYLALKELFQIEGLQFQKSERFKHLLQENEKNKKLKIIYFERKTKLEQIEAQHQRLISQVEKKASQIHQNQISAENIKTMGCSKLSESKCKLKDKLKIILSNMCMKMGVTNSADMIPALKSKLEEIKERDPVRYASIMGKEVSA